MKWKVTVYREFKEHGEVIIEADSEEDARDDAMERLTSGDDGIDWGSGDPGDQGIDDCEAA